VPIFVIEQTQFIYDGYCQHSFNYLGCRKKYADIGTRTTQFNSEGYWQHAFNYLGCRKKYDDIGTRNNTVSFPKATGNTRSTIWDEERNMPILGLEPRQFISEG